MKSSSGNQGRKLETLQDEVGSGFVNVSLVGPLPSRGAFFAAQKTETQDPLEACLLSLPGAEAAHSAWGEAVCTHATLGAAGRCPPWHCRVFTVFPLYGLFRPQGDGKMLKRGKNQLFSSYIFFLIVQPGRMRLSWTQEKKEEASPKKLCPLASKL